MYIRRAAISEQRCFIYTCNTYFEEHLRTAAFGDVQKIGKDSKGTTNRWYITQEQKE